MLHEVGLKSLYVPEQKCLNEVSICTIIHYHVTH